jgi:hypothetical protein
LCHTSLAIKEKLILKKKSMSLSVKKIALVLQRFQNGIWISLKRLKKKDAQLSRCTDELEEGAHWS